MYLSDLERPFWMLADWLEANQNLLLKNGSALSIGLPFFFCVRYWNCVHPKYTVAGVYLGVTVIAEVLGLLNQFNAKGNLDIYNAYSLLELYLLGMLYAQYTYISVFRHFIYWSALLFQPLGFYSYVAIGPYNYNVFLYAGGSVIISCYLLLYVIDAILTRKQGINYFMLWFTVGAIIFYPNTQIIYLFATKIMKEPEQLYSLWQAGLLLNISFHFFASGAIISLCREGK